MAYTYKETIKGKSSILKNRREKRWRQKDMRKKYLTPTFSVSLFNEKEDVMWVSADVDPSATGGVGGDNIVDMGNLWGGNN